MGGWEGFGDSRDCAGEEVASCALAELGADLFVVEESDEFDYAAAVVAVIVAAAACCG